MADKRPVFTENFSANLTDIGKFLGEDAKKFVDRFFNQLLNDIVPTLCRLSLSGRSFLKRSIRSSQAWELTAKLEEQLEKGDDLREFIYDAYLILYLVRGNRILFLSIKHHRQLSFDLRRFWQD